MNLVLIVVVLLLLFGGGAFYFGGPVIGGREDVLILAISLAAYFLRGFQKRSYFTARMGNLRALREPVRTRDSEKTGLGNVDNGSGFIAANCSKTVWENDDEPDNLTAD